MDWVFWDDVHLIKINTIYQIKPMLKLWKHVFYDALMSQITTNKPFALPHIIWYCIQWCYLKANLQMIKPLNLKIVKTISLWIRVFSDWMKPSKSCIWKQMKWYNYCISFYHHSNITIVVKRTISLKIFIFL